MASFAGEQHPLPELAGVTLDGRYRLVREIGRGTMGVVYEASHVTLGRRLAVKVLHHRCGAGKVRQRFFHEGRAAAALCGEHIVEVLDFGLIEQAGDLPYIVMEYLDGDTLEQRIRNHAPLEPDEAVEIAAQLLCALEVLHGAGLVHRDVKPANVMLVRARRRPFTAKLVDFGIARALNPAWRRPELTRVDQILGTPAYLSPEQAGGGAPAASWDLFAVGTILFEMLSGRLPFETKTVEQVTADIASARLLQLEPLAPSTPRWLLEVVARAHHPSISQRFASATSFVEALDARRAWPTSQEGEARTTPFVRVEPVTPPPELINALEAEPAPAGGWDLTPTSRHPRDDPRSDRPRRSASSERRRNLALFAVVGGAMVAVAAAVAAYLLTR